jgi:HEAT repeat protein
VTDAAAVRRRAAALAGHTGDESSALTALADGDPAVRATALGALDRLGRLDDALLVTALDDGSPTVRRRAAELAATRPGVPLLAVLDDADATVVEVAAFACGEQGDAVGPDVVERLTRLATSHEDALVRESAVAALGAIGAPAGLPAILAAMSDKATVRRRAVIALAPFDGPEVDAALERARSDRDWQVRQAAEDLLAE